MSASRVGYCSTSFVSSLGNSAAPTAANHLGNCPIQTDPKTNTPYDSRCYWPYCDQNGQCTGDILSGKVSPYMPGWRTDAGNTKGGCPDAAAMGFNSQCWVPLCKDGQCDGAFVNMNSTCTPLPSEMDNASSPDCVSYVCGSSGSDLGHCVRQFNVPKDCNVQNAADTCGKSVCMMTTSGIPAATCQRVANTAVNGVLCNAASKTQCTQFTCNNGACVQEALNVGNSCVPVGNATVPVCNHYVCVNNSNVGVCSMVPLPTGSACTDNNACTDEHCATVNGTGVCQHQTTVYCSQALTPVCHANGICNPATGACEFAPLPDGAACFNFSDPYCSNYSCHQLMCHRECSCGNGVLDPNEICDPTVAGTGKWCNATCMGTPPHSGGLALSAKIAIPVGIAALLAAAGAAALVIAIMKRGTGGPASPPADDPLIDATGGASTYNPLYADGVGSNNAIYEGTQ
jgi:hypothetical protein